MVEIRQTEFWEKVMDDVEGARQGGAIIIVDAEDARKGVGKTSCAVALARLFANKFGYGLEHDDLVLSGERYMDRLRNQPGKEQVSVVVWDEAVGAGSGDGRRAMSNQNVVMGRAWQTMRTKRIIHIVTLPDCSDLDARLLKLADYRVLCLRKPIGYFKAYAIGTSFDPEQGGIQTYGMGRSEGVRRVRFPNMDAMGDEYYRQLSKKKDELIQTESFDADQALATDGGEEASADPEEVKEQTERREAIKMALRAVKPWDDDRGMTQEEAGNIVGYSRAWVGHRVREYEQGKLDDIVADIDQAP